MARSSFMILYTALRAKWSATAPPHGAKLRSRQNRATVFVALIGTALTYLRAPRATLR